MSATVDVNILLYACDESSSLYAKAAELIEQLAGPEVLCLFRPVLMTYLRMATHPAIFPRPLSVGVASGNVGPVLGLRHACALGEGWRLLAGVWTRDGRHGA